MPPQPPDSLLAPLLITLLMLVTFGVAVAQAMAASERRPVRGILSQVLVALVACLCVATMKYGGLYYREREMHWNTKVELYDTRNALEEQRANPAPKP